MKVHLVFPVLPPILDGIGDYTSRLAGSLAEHTSVTILTGQGPFDPIEGVRIVQAFSMDAPLALHRLHDQIVQDAPDWLIVQYNPFSYGRWGFNPALPAMLQKLRKTAAGTRIALMVHEPFMPVESVRMAVMTTWQRWQLWRLGHGADLVFFAIEPWVERFRAWFADKPVFHLPVSSNIPHVPITRNEARRRIGVDEDTFVLGVFGSAHPSRLLNFIKTASEAVRAIRERMCLLYIGPAGNRVREILGDIRVFDAGPLPPEDVSKHFAAMDLYLAPFRKGVSTRRGSFMVGLQHEIATVSTYGIQTDAELYDQHGKAFLLSAFNDEAGFRQNVLELVEDARRRNQIAANGQDYFNTRFSWECVTDSLLRRMAEVDGKSFGVSSLSGSERVSADSISQRSIV
jgi:glycosyltransferase involved in cell wall biosynthesis